MYTYRSMCAYQVEYCNVLSGFVNFELSSQFYCFVFFLQDVVIQSDDEIRIKIVGTRVDAKDIVSILSR